MSMNLVTLLYLVASVCFIQALKGLSHPTTSIRGNLFGMIGMTIAVLTTAALIVKLSETAGLSTVGGLGYVLAALVVGGGAGALMAQRVEMTKMPELVAFMHSMIGLAAVFIAVAAVAEPYAFQIVHTKGDLIPTGNRLELFLGAAIGAITFSGSVIAFGKLSGKYKFRLFQGAPVQFAGQHMLNLVLGLATVGLGLAFMVTENWTAFFAMLALAFVMGVLPLVLSTGAGAEMRRAMGVAVFAGMIGVTAFGLFLTPVFYVLLRRLTGNRPLIQHGSHVAPVGPADLAPAASGAQGRPVLAAPRQDHD